MILSDLNIHTHTHTQKKTLGGHCIDLQAIADNVYILCKLHVRVSHQFADRCGWRMTGSFCGSCAGGCWVQCGSRAVRLHAGGVEAALLSHLSLLRFK